MVAESCHNRVPLDPIQIGTVMAFANNSQVLSKAGWCALKKFLNSSGDCRDLASPSPGVSSGNPLTDSLSVAFPDVFLVQEAFLLVFCHPMCSSEIFEPLSSR